MPAQTQNDGVFRIAAFSGYSGDRWDALKNQALNSGCDILFGDYLAEMVSEVGVVGERRGERGLHLLVPTGLDRCCEEIRPVYSLTAELLVAHLPIWSTIPLPPWPRLAPRCGSRPLIARLTSEPGNPRP